MSGTRYTADFKAEAVKQVTDRGHGVVEVAKRLGISGFNDLVGQVFPDGISS